MNGLNIKQTIMGTDKELYSHNEYFKKFNKEIYNSDLKKVVSTINSIEIKAQFKTCENLIFNFQTKWGWYMYTTNQTAIEYESDVNSLLSIYINKTNQINIS